MSGDYVLVLVNGKRRHTNSLTNNLSCVSGGSSPVDIDLLAANAIGRVEVVRDGAAVQYGADAISGVINFASPEGGSHYEKGGALIQQSVSYGTIQANTRSGLYGNFTPFGLSGGFYDAAGREILTGRLSRLLQEGGMAAA